MTNQIRCNCSSRNLGEDHGSALPAFLTRWCVSRTRVCWNPFLACPLLRPHTAATLLLRLPCPPTPRPQSDPWPSSPSGKQNSVNALNIFLVLRNSGEKDNPIIHLDHVTKRLLFLSQQFSHFTLQKQRYRHKLTWVSYSRPKHRNPV